MVPISKNVWNYSLADRSSQRASDFLRGFSSPTQQARLKTDTRTLSTLEFQSMGFELVYIKGSWLSRVHIM